MGTIVEVAIPGGWDSGDVCGCEPEELPVENFALKTRQQGTDFLQLQVAQKNGNGHPTPMQQPAGSVHLRALTGRTVQQVFPRLFWGIR